MLSFKAIMPKSFRESDMEILQMSLDEFKMMFPGSPGLCDCCNCQLDEYLLFVVNRSEARCDDCYQELIDLGTKMGVKYEPTLLFLQLERRILNEI